MRIHQTDYKSCFPNQDKQSKNMMETLETKKVSKVSNELNSIANSLFNALSKMLTIPY